MDMNKHLVKEDDSKPVHSSGFAQVASGDRIGSTSTTSFSERQKIEAARKYIQNYRSSLLANHREAAKSVALSEREGTLRVPEREGMRNYKIRLNAPKKMEHRFVEPKPRMYDPFA